jgi:hypothetical protein
VEEGCLEGKTARNGRKKGQGRREALGGKMSLGLQLSIVKVGVGDRKRREEERIEMAKTGMWM